MQPRIAILSIGMAIVIVAACSDVAPTPVVPTTPRATEGDSALEAPLPEEAARANEWIVAFRNGVSFQPKLDSLGVKTDYVYVSVFNGFSATLKDWQYRRLRDDPDVEFLEQNRLIEGASVQSSAPWNLDRIDQRSSDLDGWYEYPNTGSRVRVYVIDSGIDYDHREFDGRASAGFDDVPGGLGGRDCSGHGTHVAGTIGGTTYGVAKEVRLISVRVLNCNDVGTVARLLAGMEWVAVNRQLPAVANIAMAVKGYSPALNAAATRLYNRDVVVVAAAGNFHEDACDYYPAGSPHTFTVGATKRDDSRAPFSNYGPCVEIFAPGNKVRSAKLDGIFAADTMSGTSVASAHAAGVAALYLDEHPAAPPERVYTEMIRSSTPDVIPNHGTGPNRLLSALLPPMEVSVGLGCSKSAPTTVSCTAYGAGGSYRFTFRWNNGFVDGPSISTSHRAYTCSAGSSVFVSVTATDDVTGVQGSKSMTVSC